MLTFLTYTFQVFLIILLADLISGIGHWFEDVYGHPDWPILGKYIVKPNIEHHYKPRKFLGSTYLHRNSTSFAAAFIVLSILFTFNWLNWQSILFVAYLSQVNEVHAMSHRRASENPLIVRFFQRIGLVQSSLHHGWHHKAPYDCNYCIMTEYLNPVLYKIRFWGRIEEGLKLIGIQPLRATEIRNGY